MIFIENLKITTRITVCNYDTYNDSVNAEYTPSKRQVNAKYTPSKREQHTNNNVKNDNNVNNENKRGGEEILPPPKLIESDLCSYEEKQNQIAINETNSPTNEIQKEKKVATKKRKYKSPLELGLVIPPIFQNGLKESFLEFCEMRATRTGKKKLPVDSQRKINRLANDLQKLEKYDQEIQKEIIEYSTDHLYDSFYIPNHLKQEKNNNHEKSDGEIILERIQKKYDL